MAGGHNHINAYCNAADFILYLLHIIAQIGLCQHDNWRCTAIPRHGKIAFETARVVVVIERHADKDNIDIGRDGLRLAAYAHGGALKNAFARQNRLNKRVVGVFAAALDHDKIADGRKISRAGCVVAEFAGYLGQALARFVGDLIQRIIL
ncbi:hypothetical protein SDC9_143504 [bioreactor metagenome]|uniref:Uncharacterized protein n=1 Tax=bioreactor metagenome TaxID=1076179 RepID=A0A645E3H1_9ZZZZ